MAESDTKDGKTQAAQAAPAQKPQQQQQRATASHVLGEVAWLMARSASHQNYRMGDLNWFAIPPIMLGQYRMFLGNPEPAADGTRAQGQGEIPMGIALWAMFSKEVERRFVQSVQEGKGPVILKPQDWNSGNRLWLIELIAPFATPENKQIGFMMDDFLKNGLVQAFPKAKDQTLKFFQRDQETGERKVREFKATFRDPDGNEVDVRGQRIG